MCRVAVVGAGVVGLTVAHELAGAGHRVVVCGAAGGVSDVAAALWFPHAVDRSPQVLASARAKYERFVELAARPATGVRLRRGRVLTRRPAPDLSWTGAVPGCEPLPADEAPPGACGVRCTLPVVLPDVYLPWLRDAVLALGVALRREQVSALAPLVAEHDAVVVAAGLASAALLGDDDEVFPVRGQVVRLANPGLTDWVLDEDNPQGLTYVVPRDDDVVCGGTGEVGSYDEQVHPDVEAAVLERVTALVPELRGQPVRSRAAGLRPARTSVRLEQVPGWGGAVYACYGHGSAGYTLSWGDAARVAALVGP